jgi:hypothetical protein
MVSGFSDPVKRGRAEEFELAAPDGGKIKVPGDYAGGMLGLVFVEPTAPDSGGSNLVARASEFCGCFESKGAKVVTVFLSDDTNLVASLVKDSEPQLKAGMLPGGLGNPLVQKLGILSADRVPNAMLLRPDGTIAWAISGLEYKYFGGRGPESAIGYAIERNIDKVITDRAFTALEKGDYEDALKLFDEHEPVDYWAADCLQGRALAHMGRKDWQSALTAVDAALNRRINDFSGGICKCHGVVEMYLTKATILEKLGRSQDAAEAKQQAARQTLPHAKLPPGIARKGVPVGVYYSWLKLIRLDLEAKDK